jgi:hypothetical protein
MRAFISFSVNDSEQNIVSILSMKLQDQGYSTITNYTYSNSVVGVNKSHLFIGIITSNDNESNKKVFDDWKYATAQNIPALLLVEKNKQIGLFENPFQQAEANNPNFISFDRKNAEPSVAIAQLRIEEATKNIAKNEYQHNGTNWLAWMLAGVPAITVMNLFTKGVKNLDSALLK